MGRPSLKEVVEAKVGAYLEDAIKRSPAEKPISAVTVARAIGHDRRLITKYDLLPRVLEAARLQKRAAGSAVEVRRRTFEERLKAGEAEGLRMKTQIGSLLAQQALLEANLKRLGIDPEEVYRPIVPPDRSVSAIHKRRRPN